MSGYYRDRVIRTEDLLENVPEKGEYESCKFIGLDLSNQDLSDFIFESCVFESCNLSMVKVRNTRFRGCRFESSKLWGIHWENCNTFGLELTFIHSALNHSSFYQLNLKNTRFDTCQLVEVDFTEVNLAGAQFIHSELAGSKFEHTNLEKANLSSAFNWVLDPENNRIKGMVVGQSQLEGLLEKYKLKIDRAT